MPGNSVERVAVSVRRIDCSQTAKTMRGVRTQAAPMPAGHYEQAVVHAGLVFVSGQLPVDPVTRQPERGPVEAQTLRALDNVKAIVQASGSDLSRVLKVTVYVTDVSLWGRVNEAYASFFGDHRPARVVVPVPELHDGVLVEIDAVAAVG